MVSVFHFSLIINLVLQFVNLQRCYEFIARFTALILNKYFKLAIYSIANNLVRFIIFIPTEGRISKKTP